MQMCSSLYMVAIIPFQNPKRQQTMHLLVNLFQETNGGVEDVSFFFLFKKFKTWGKKLPALTTFSKQV